MDKKNILIITPVQHLRSFYSKIFKNFKFLELINPTYEDVKFHIRSFNILFCAPNFQKFIIDEELIKNTGLVFAVPIKYSLPVEFVKSPASDKPATHFSVFPE